MRQLRNCIGDGYGSAQFWELNKQEVDIRDPPFGGSLNLVMEPLQSSTTRL